jgi:hypothetical protein
VTHYAQINEWGDKSKMNPKIVEKLNKCKNEEEFIEYCKKLEMLPLFR